MLETKLSVGVIQYLLKNNRLFDAISTGLTILNFNLEGDVKITNVSAIEVKSRGDEPAMVIEFEVGDKKLQMIDSQFLQSLVVTKDHFAEMVDKVNHEHTFQVKGNKSEEFKNLFFFEDVDDKGLRNADAIQPIHKALGLGEGTNSEVDLGSDDFKLKLVGIMVNKRRDDDVALFDHEFPRSKAGSYPGYRDLRTAWEDAGNDGIYTIGMYADDYKEKNGKNPNIQGVVNVPRNWSFTPIFVDEGGKLIKTES